MKIKTTEFSINFFHYQDKTNYFSAGVIDNSYHFNDGFTVDITVFRFGVEVYYSFDFDDQLSAFCFLYSFFNSFFGEVQSD